MSLLNTLVGNFSADLIALIGGDFAQVFQPARPMRVMNTNSADVMEHPVEDGSAIADHIVFKPAVIEISLFVQATQARNTLMQLKSAWRRGELFTVQGRTESYENMAMTDLPYEETAEMTDAIVIVAKFKEVVFITPEYGELPPRKVQNKADSDTMKRGGVNSTSVPEQKQGSFLSRITGVSG